MNPLQRSANCPVIFDKRRGTTDEGTRRYVEGLVVLQVGAMVAWPEVEQESQLASITKEFRKDHSGREQLAAQSCARIIADGSCPLWRLGETGEGIVVR